jgi:hypothetical protein
MVCRYCGLETGSGVGHRSQAECIQALTAEIDRAKALVNRAKDAELLGRTVEPATKQPEQLPVT